MTDFKAKIEEIISELPKDSYEAPVITNESDFTNKLLSLIHLAQREEAARIMLLMNKAEQLREGK